MKRSRITLITAPLALSAALWLSGPIMAQEPVAHHEAHETLPESSHGAPASGGHGAAKTNAHHGPEVTLFGKTLNTNEQFGIKLLNFVIFAGFLFLILKGALSAAFKARAKDLEEKLAAAAREKAEANTQIQALESRMTGMQAELDSILSKAEADAETEKQRVLKAAWNEARQIISQAQQEIEYQKRLAEKELRALVAELAVEGATKRLEAQVQGPLANRMIDMAVQKVGGAK